MNRTTIPIARTYYYVGPAVKALHMVNVSKYTKIHVESNYALRNKHVDSNYALRNKDQRSDQMKSNI